jgi:hypothetical protein
LIVNVEPGIPEKDVFKNVPAPPPPEEVAVSIKDPPPPPPPIKRH